MSNNFGISRLLSCHSFMKLIFFLPYCKKNIEKNCRLLLRYLFLHLKTFVFIKVKPKDMLGFA